MNPEEAHKKAMLRVRKRLLDEFDYYSQHAIKIRTKNGEIAPLKLNEAQRRLLDAVDAQMAAEGRVRVVILKARQMGLSTAVGAWLYWYVSQHSAQKALVVTHHADSTKALFDMTKRFYDNTPDILKPATKYASRRELKFNILDSGYVVATAGGDGVARGETITHAHLSELAFWPKSSAKENLNGILQAIPNSKGTAVFIESTANGVTGEFYNMWRGAVEGTNGYIPIFLPWFIQDEYREDVPEGFTPTPDELDLIDQFGLDYGQLMFRRRKIAQNGLDAFKQEYPSCAEEAFLTTGRPVFNAEAISARASQVGPTLDKMALEGEKFVSHPRGELSVFIERDPQETYYIGADVAMGVRGGDWSVAQVLDSRKRQVAVWRGHVHPDYFATVLYHLGFHYNEARIIVENNNHGILTCTRLGKDLAYPYFFTETVYDKLMDKETITLGFRTTVKTKPLIIDELRAAHRDGEIELNDANTLREMATYIVTETGNMSAEEGCHDDTVIALALANHIHAGAFTPIPSIDDYYIDEMI